MELFSIKIRCTFQLVSTAFEYFPFVFYLAPYYEYVASCLSNSASLRVKYGFANGD